MKDKKNVEIFETLCAGYIDKTVLRSTTKNDRTPLIYLVLTLKYFKSFLHTGLIYANAYSLICVLCKCRKHNVNFVSWHVATKRSEKTL